MQTRTYQDCFALLVGHDRQDQCLAAIGEKSGCLADHLRAELQLG